MSFSSDPGAKGEPLDKDVVARLRIEASQGDKDFFPQYLEFFRQDLEEAANGLVAGASEKSAYQLQAVAHRLRSCGQLRRAPAHRFVYSAGGTRQGAADR